MKTLIFVLVFPLISWSLTEKEIVKLKSENPSFVIAACEENSYLRGCFHLKEDLCKTEVKKSLDSCWKFIEKKSKLSAFSVKDWQKKISSCVFREVAPQWKDKAERTPACALPEREAL